jgi:hypothetical protein
MKKMSFEASELFRYCGRNCFDRLFDNMLQNWQKKLPKQDFCCQMVLKSCHIGYKFFG